MWGKKDIQLTKMNSKPWESKKKKNTLAVLHKAKQASDDKRQTAKFLNQQTQNRTKTKE